MKKNNKNSSFLQRNRKGLSSTLLLVIAVLLVAVVGRSFALGEIATGTSGDCDWKIDSSGKLIISPQEGNTECVLGEANPNHSWYSNKNDITSVEVKEGVKANENSSGLFNDLSNVTSMDLTNLDTTDVTNMSSMFHNCSSLTDLNISKFKTDIVTDMSYMFENCGFTSLNISSFNTIEVTNMEGMFSGCSKLTNLNLSNFNTSNVTNMHMMFYLCDNLANLNISNFNTNNVTNMKNMFGLCCRNMTTLDLKNFDISNAADITQLIGGTIGKETSNGAKLILNNSFNKDYSTNSNYYIPYTHYAKEENGVLSNKLYTLSEMHDAVVNSNTPTSWIPAYSVTFNPNGTSEKEGKMLIEGEMDDEYIDTLTIVQKIGTKIDTKDIKPIRKNDALTKWTNTSNVDDATLIIIKDEKSENTFGDRYASVGTNNNITLYAQYEENALKKDVIFIKKDKRTDSPIEGATFKLYGRDYNNNCYNETVSSNNMGKVIFRDVPVGKYKLVEVTPAENYLSNKDEILVKVGEDEVNRKWRSCND